MDANTKTTPVVPGTDLWSNDVGQQLEDRSLYLSIIGRLIYISVHRRSDVAFLISRLCEHNQTPESNHLEMSKRVFRYLKPTINYKLRYKLRCESIDVYCDADYGNDKNSSKSINGQCTFVYWCLVNWSSKKQSKVSTSTCQAELLAIADGVSELIYIKQLMSDFVNVIPEKINLFNDNNGAIATCHNGGDFVKNKHYRIKINYIMEELLRGWLKISHCPSTRMVDDLLTKPLTSSKMISLLNATGIN